MQRQPRLQITDAAAWQVTDWMPTGETFPNHHGAGNARQWCHMEAARMNGGGGGPAMVAQRRHGREVCVARLQVKF